MGVLDCGVGVVVARPGYPNPAKPEPKPDRIDKMDQD
jgi:hypothetical protein